MTGLVKLTNIGDGMNLNRQQNNATIKNHFDAWDMYKPIIDNNWMFHNELYLELDKLLNTTFTSKKFSFLDLGCGDASCVAKVLSNSNIAGYIGVDLSEVVTKLAETNLQSVTPNRRFINGDFVRQMRDLIGQQFDVIFTGFALHHYTTKEKQEFFNLAKQLLKPDGILTVIDVVCTEGQTVTEAVNNSIAYFSKCNGITPEVLSKSSEHILNYDIPETISTYQKMASNANFTAFEEGPRKEMFQLFTCRV